MINFDDIDSDFRISISIYLNLFENHDILIIAVVIFLIQESPIPQCPVCFAHVDIFDELIWGSQVGKLLTEITRENCNSECCLAGIELFDFKSTRVLRCSISEWLPPRSAEDWVVSLKADEQRHHSTVSLVDRPMKLWVFPPRDSSSEASNIMAEDTEAALEHLKKCLDGEDMLYRVATGHNGFQFLLETSFRTAEILANRDGQWGDLRIRGLHFDKNEPVVLPNRLGQQVVGALAAFGLVKRVDNDIYDKNKKVRGGGGGNTKGKGKVMC